MACSKHFYTGDNCFGKGKMSMNE